MARYAFNLRYGPRPDDLVLDPEGEECADLDAARTRALSVARDFLDRGRSDVVRNWFACAFEITDAGGCHVAVVPFSDAVTDKESEAD